MFRAFWRAVGEDGAMTNSKVLPADESRTAMTHRGDRVRVLGAGTPRLLVFVPAAFTPVCAGEVGELAALASRAEVLGVRILVVSCDAAATLAAWLRDADPTGGVTGVSDHWPHGELARLCDAFDEDAGVALRRTWAIRADGTRKLVASSAPGLPRDATEHARGIEWAAGTPTESIDVSELRVETR